MGAGDGGTAQGCSATFEFCQRNGREDLLALLPREPVEPPASERAAMMLIVEIAFEPLAHMIYPLHSGFDQRLTCFQGAFSAAADEYYRCAAASFLVAYRSSEHVLSYVRDEMWIDGPVGLVDPGNVDRALGVPDKQILHCRADVDQDGTGIVAQQVPRLLGTELADMRSRLAG